MNRWKLWLPLVLFAGFCLVAVWPLLHPPSSDIHSQLIGKPLPQFSLKPASPDLPGVSTQDFRDGKPKLLNVFASWCVPCAAEAPQLGQLQRQGATIVGIDLRDRPEDLAQFLAGNGNPFARIGADDIGAVQLGIGSSGVPETFVIDGQGTIRYQHIGDIRQDDVAMLLGKLKEAES
ncbi:MAG: DsbE family thiol:disulfide interchange protein [Candidatus Andeanibacterium colombiense]|uniref:DsbE family thiol:disulfide interchange protein n=1 Tax=Candidatus Andeanibacterium colombiense TaxID=3121345 RepID=A0AAJ5X2Y3_9SPHN|nr:MAG: DsbE family thiol:disulfide interchange protein [Sphingomonadaceae bacterium]